MANTQSEPSMDEILASIRRIISEEDETPTGEAAQSPATEPLTLENEAVGDKPEIVTEMAAEAAHPVDDFSFDDDETDETAANAADELMKEAPMSELNGKAEPKSVPQSAGATLADTTARLANLVGGTAATQASAAFNTLEHNVRVSNGTSRTIEDVIEAMLAPMLKEWLDMNLPRIVEEKVEEEVRRIARRH